MSKKTKKNKAIETIWQQPDLGVINDELPPPPKLPADVFGVWGEWIISAAKSKSAPPDYIALPLLCATAGLISNVRRGKAHDGWVEPTILWGALVGLPSTGKSPALDIVLNPLRKIEDELATSYRDETLHKFHEDYARSEAIKAEYQRSLKGAIKNGDDCPQMPAEAIEPEKPPRPRLVVTDTTIEKVALLLMHNARGLILFRDELSGLLTNFERYGGGSDREFYLEAFGGRPYTVDRASRDEPLIVPYNSLSITGSIQPDKLERLLKNSEDDGFSARFLYAYPERVPIENPSAMIKPDKLYHAFKRLHRLSFDDCRYREIPFTKEAAEEFLEWRRGNVKAEDSASGMLLSLLGKMPGLVIRIATVLAYLDWSADENHKEPEVLTLTHVDRAMQLIDDYFIPMAWRTFGYAALPKAQRDARAIAKYIIRNKSKEINLRDFRRMSMSPVTDVGALEAAVHHLVDCNWLELAESNSTGRKAKTYMVNPLLYT